MSLLEKESQKLIFEWKQDNLKNPKLKGIQLLHSTLNGASLAGNKQQRIRQWNSLLRQGAKKGIHDILLPVARHGFNCLWIELKREDGTNKPTKEQLKWKELVEEEGGKAEFCYGHEPAIELIKWYLGEQHD